ncbi:hypothetical protein IL306_006276 [Fusarium sp. DS 682]|nr:hypothetical protein IL306_006276 [Fusarium sp. DS 682]
MLRRLQREEYTVGWICALPIELAAARKMLDEEHQSLERDPKDGNLYSLGSIAGHNVVIVCLPAGRIGYSPAAGVATQMKATFKGIRFGLMVGIGGGVPSAEADIRLGDVVVSQPHRTSGGVVQYDFGKATPRGFERAGSLDSPPQILLGAVARVRADELLGRSTLSKHISKLDDVPTFQRGRVGPDLLFEATYDHEGGQSCALCSTERLKDRQPRESGQVIIHYGTIASGNQVIRDGRTRDRLSRELGGILCFEMEAAGLMHTFPCLVIRGICDYADSHKNKTWQAYAAGMAAVYANGILSAIPLAETDKTNTLHEALVVDQLTSTGSLVAYFYCQSNDKKTLTAMAIFTCFLRQISNAAPPPSLPSLIREAYFTRVQNGFASENLTFEETADLLRHLLNAYGPVTFVLDALDECAEGERSQILSEIYHLINSVRDSAVKVFISSRVYIDIGPKLLAGLRVCVDAVANLEDISSFVHDSVDALQDRDHLHWARSKDVRDEIKTVLQARADGM